MASATSTGSSRPNISGPIVPVAEPGTVLDVTPQSAGWRDLAFAVHELAAGHVESTTVDDRETAIVLLSGSANISVANGVTVDLARTSVFDELVPVVYVTPGDQFTVTAGAGGATFSVGSAPAEGRYPSRVIGIEEQRSEIRGGGTSYRQVIHTLASPVEAERLILYQVYVPRGTWAGWPPHRHDGVAGSPYLEEVYYFRLDRPEGYVLHRNFCDGQDGDEFDEVVVAHDGDVVLVPKGYHTTVTSPGSNMYFLNYLAGDLIGDERSTPPCFHSEHTWIEADWNAGEWELPVVPTTPTSS